MRILENFGDMKSKLSGGLAPIPRGELNAQTIINWIYSFVAIVAVGFLIYGGIGYINSHGDPAKTAKAKNTIVAAVAGLVIVSLAGAITNFVFHTVAESK